MAFSKTSLEIRQKCLQIHFKDRPSKNTVVDFDVIMTNIHKYDIQFVMIVISLSIMEFEESMATSSDYINRYFSNYVTMARDLRRYRKG